MPIFHLFTTFAYVRGQTNTIFVYFSLFANLRRHIRFFVNLWILYFFLFLYFSYSHVKQMWYIFDYILNVSNWLLFETFQYWFFPLHASTDFEFSAHKACVWTKGMLPQVFLIKIHYVLFQYLEKVCWRTEGFT